tara:strand:- start:267 stop:524 length:258 start_codon:yes stop_codon:yes gene_type:complete
MIISVLQTLKLKVDGAPIFTAGFKNYHSKNNSEDRRITLGRFSLIKSPLGEYEYLLTRINDFKTAVLLHYTENLTLQLNKHGQRI